jgi:hypothetical protein
MRMDRWASQPHLPSSTLSTFSTHSRNLVMFALQNQHIANMQTVVLLPPSGLWPCTVLRDG